MSTVYGIKEIGKGEKKEKKKVMVGREAFFHVYKFIGRGGQSLVAVGYLWIKQ